MPLLQKPLGNTVPAVEDVSLFILYDHKTVLGVLSPILYFVKCSRRKDTALATTYSTYCNLRRVCRWSGVTDDCHS